MKFRFSLLLPGVLLSLLVGAQTPSVRFSQLPAPLQLYPRGADNQAEVTVAGAVLQSGYQRVSVQVFRNNGPFAYRSQNLAYAGSEASFTLRSPIRAELAEYRFDVFVHGRGGDSVRIARRDSILCGDVYLVAGQSNAATLPEAVKEYGQVGEFYRTFGRFTDQSEAPYNPADTLWALANQTDAQRVGVWAHELQRLIATTYKIPVAVLNGAFPGAGIQYLVPNPTNPADLTTPYGRMLYRVQKAGIVGKTKALFWWQGELDSYRSIPNYPERFDTLYRAWQRDFSNLQKIYVAQIAIINEPSGNAGAIRDFQRRLPDLYPNVVAWSSLGSAGFDGLHYSTEGYRRHGEQWFRLVARDFYGSTDTRNVASPAVRKVFFTTPEKRDITLVFDENQDLVVQPDSVLLDKNGNLYTRRLINYLYLDGVGESVERLSASGNRVQLRLKAPTSASRLTYLPLWFRDEAARFNTYDGPHLRNARGLAAFSFENVPIATSLVAPSLTAQALSSTEIQLSWRSITPGATELILERSLAATGPYTEIRRLPVAPGALTDPNLQPATTYFYQIRAVSATAESLPSATLTTTTLLPAPTLSADAVGTGQIRLTWKTLATGTPKSYVLERSLRAGADYTPLSTLAAASTEFTDTNLPAQTTYHYRLKALTEANESDWATTSATTAVITGTEPGPAALRVYPNPARGALTVENPGREPAMIQLLDATGVVRLDATRPGLTTTEIRIPALPPGAYVIRLTRGDQTTTQRLVVAP